MNTEIVVKLSDVILDPAHPVDLTAMSAGEAVELVRRAYGVLAKNMTFEVRDGFLVITIAFEERQGAATAKETYARAIQQAKGGRPNKAIDLFRRVLAVVPHHPEAHRNLAMALMSADRLTEAKDHLVDSLRLEPDNAWAYMLLGNIFAKHERNLEIGERYLKKACELAPEDAHVVTNYAALKTDKGEKTEAEALFRQAIGIDPAQPNAHYGLATLLSDANRPADAREVLDRMFAVADFTDARLRGLQKQCREYYLRLCARLADEHCDGFWKMAIRRKAEIESLTGFPVELVEDNSLHDTTATSAAAWATGRDVHCVRYNGRGKAVVPAIVVRELELIRMEFEARQGGATVETVCPRDNPIRSREIERQARADAGNALEIGQVADALLTRDLAMVRNAIADARAWERLPGLRPSYFVHLYLRANENVTAMRNVGHAVPPHVRRAHEMAAAAYAFLVDGALKPRTEYGAEYAGVGTAPMARELAEDWLRCAAEGRPGEEYGLTRSFVRHAGIGDWVDFRPSMERRGAGPA